MAYQVSYKTREQTTKCPYDFICLDNETWDTCTIKRDIQGAFLEIKTKSNKIGCPYRCPFGYSYFFCACPTRCEIYRRYDI